VLLDTLGCAVAGFDSPPGRISRAVFAEMGGASESTLIGTGGRLPCASAAFVNGTIVRYQDLNDTYLRAGAIGHYSEIIPTVLAVGERAGASGSDLLGAIVLGYELLGSSNFHGPRVVQGVATFGSIAVPALAGRILGLNPDQIANAIGLALTTGTVLLTWFGERTDMPMIKSSVFSSTAHNGILSALLAQKGFTGPQNAVNTYLENFEVPERYEPPAPGEFTVLEHNLIKGYAAQVYTLAPIEAVLQLVREHELADGAVDEVIVRGSDDLVRLAAKAAAYLPSTREAADHSAPYVLAMAILEGDVLPAQYERRQWEDESVLSLMQKIHFEGGGARPFGARVEIRSGQSVHALEIEAPRGHPENPMTEEEVRGKFRRLVAGRLNNAAQERVIELVARFEQAAGAGPLLEALAIG
jgi:2-methylcitrate dehydratase